VRWQNISEKKEKCEIIFALGYVFVIRLTEDAGCSVLLLEAGLKDTWLGSKFLNWKIHMPAALTYLCDDK